MVSVNVVVLVTPPPVPVMVMVELPGLAFDDTLMRTAAVPLPGDEIVAGLIWMTTPEGAPEAVNEIDESKLPVAAVVTFTAPCPPGATVTFVGADLMVKLAITGTRSLIRLGPFGLPIPQEAS